MDFGNGKTSYKSYSERVYGQDINIQIQQQQERRQAIRLPVFGLKTANDAFAAIIEEGDALASIEAAVAGKGTGYNMAAAGFQVRSTGYLPVSAIPPHHCPRARWSTPTGRSITGASRCGMCFLAVKKLLMREWRDPTAAICRKTVYWAIR